MIDFNDIWKDVLRPTTKGEVWPKTFADETADSLVLTLEMPGVSPENVTVDLKGTKLKVTGKGEHRTYVGEYQLARVGDTRQATMKDGLLKVTIKSESPSSSIPVLSG